MFTMHAVLLLLMLIAVLWGVVAGETPRAILMPFIGTLPFLFGVVANSDTEHRAVLAALLLAVTATVWLGYAMHAARRFWLRRRYSKTGREVAVG